MQTIITIWNIYSTICGVIGVMVIILIIGIKIKFELQKVRCPECGNTKFYVATGGPPSCTKYDWRENKKWKENNPNKKIRGKYYILNNLNITIKENKNGKTNWFQSRSIEKHT